MGFRKPSVFIFKDMNSLCVFLKLKSCKRESCGIKFASALNKILSEISCLCLKKRFLCIHIEHTSSLSSVKAKNLIG